MIQLDEEVEGMQSTILTLQQQLKDTKQLAAHSEEITDQLKQKLEQTESMLEDARQQAAQDSGTREDQDTHAHSQPEPEPELRTSGSWKVDADARNIEERILSPSESTSKPRSSAVSAFSISNLLATDSEKTEECGRTHASNLENGQQGGDLLRGAPFEPSVPRLSVAKGLAEGIGEGVNTFNGEVVG